MRLTDRLHRTLLAFAIAASTVTFVAPSTAEAATTTPSYVADAFWPERDFDFINPSSVAVDATGTVFLVDSHNSRILRYGASGVREAVWGGKGSLPGQLDSPQAIAVSGGRLYVADTGNHRVQVFSASDFSFVTSFGSYGSGDSGLSSPRGIAVVGSNVYVTDTGNSRIQVFNVGGAPLFRFGTAGSSLGNFSNPQAIASDGTYLYVADTGNMRIQKWDLSGAMVPIPGAYGGANWWGPYSSSEGNSGSRYASPVGITVDALGRIWVADDQAGRVEACTSDAGVVLATFAVATGGPTFSLPKAIAFGPSGNGYLLESGANRVQRLSLGGTLSVPELSFVSLWEAAGGAPGQLSYPRGLARSGTGAVYVADTGNDRLQVFSAAGVPSGVIGGPGSEPGQFNSPRDVALDASGDLYVADAGNHRIQKLTPSGSVVWTSGSAGPGPGEFNTPTSVVVGQDGSIWIADTGNHRVQRLNADGSFAGQWGSLGTGTGQFSSPSGLALDGAGNIYVADTGNHRVQKFGPGMTFERAWGSSGVALGSFSSPSGIGVSALGEVIVADTGNERIQVFTTDGSYLAVTGTFGSLLGQLSQPVDIAVEPDGAFLVAERSGHRVQHFDVVRGDEVPPVTTSNMDTLWHRGSFQVTLTASDNGGVAGTRYRVGASSEATYTGPFTITTQGQTTVEYWSVDVAGNRETTRTASVKVDSEGPVTTSSNTGLWYRNNVSLSLTATDAHSGVQAVSYQVGAGSWTPYGSAISISTEGSTIVRYSATDMVGNVEATKTTTVLLDKTPPSTSTGVNGQTFNGPAEVVLAGTDALSSVANITYILDGGGEQPYTGAFVVAGLGSHTIQYWATDMAGNRESTRTATFTITGSIPLTTSNIDAAWHAGSFTASLTASGVSPIRATYYRIGEGATTTYTVPFTISTAGQTTVVYWSVDTMGNVEGGNIRTVKVDKVAPATTASVPAGWQRGAAFVTLSATDADSGVSKTYYRVAGGAPSEYPVGGISVSTPGTSTLQWWSVDAAGNVETTKSATVYVDASAPSVSSNMSGLWSHESSFTVALAGFDTASGLAAIRYRVNGGAAATYTAPFAVTAEGQTQVTYWGVDVAGNESTPRDGAVLLDRSTPLSTSNADAVWHKGSFVVSLAATDAPSGVMTTFYRVQGGPLYTYAAPFTVDGGGPVAVEFYSKDFAGNTEPTRTAVVKVDGIAPSTASNVGDGWSKTPVSVVLSPSDGAGVGVQYTRYRVAGGALATYTAPFMVSSPGLTNIEYFSADSLGNVEETKSATVRIDATPPGTASSLGGSWSRSEIEVTLVASDALSGVASTYYRVGSGAVTTYTVPFTVSDPGATTVTFWSVDRAGNAEPAKSAQAKVDLWSPETTASPGTGWHKAPYAMSLVATDHESGVSFTEYSITGTPEVYAGSVVLAAHGDNTVLFRSTDVAGNVESWKSVVAKVDALAPSTTSDIVEGWHRDPVTVTLEASDQGSGLAYTCYRVGAGAVTTYTAPFIVSSPGETPVTYWSADAVGNIEATRTSTVRIDARTPLTISSVDDGQWLNAPFEIEFSVEVPQGDSATTFYRVDGGSTQIYAAPVPVIYDGQHVVDFWSVSGSGRSEATRTITVGLDVTMPRTRSDASGTWEKAARSLALTGEDDLSGIAETYYYISQPTTVSTYSGPLDFGQEGVYIVGYWSVDRAGNVEATRTTAVFLDWTPPVTQSSVGTTWSKEPVTLELYPEDAVSGVPLTWLGIGGEPVFEYWDTVLIEAEGTTPIVFWSRDGAGNVEQTRTAEVRIDYTPPSTSSDMRAEYPGPALISLSATDALSGVAATFYRLDGGPVRTGTSVYATALGTHTLEFWSEDRAGNVETAAEASSFVVTVDETDPEVSITTPAEGAVASASVTPTWTVNEPATSVATLNGNAYTPGTPIGEGLWTLDVTATDLSGNVGTASVTFAVDLHAPVTVSDAPSGTVDGAITVTLGATDNLSGVASTLYSLDGAGPTVYVAPISVGAGAHTLEFWSVDVAGNVENANSAEFRVTVGLQVGQVAGGTRYATALEASKRGFPSGITADDPEGERTVIVASGANFPDALCASSLAGAVGGPLLLTQPTALPDAALIAELDRLGATRVIIVGGSGAVSDAVKNSIQTRAGVAIERIAGADRYATADAIAARTVGLLGDGFDGTAIVATGETYADAVAGAPLAAGRGWPMYLARRGTIGAADLDSMAADGVTDALILGGTGAVSAASYSALDARFGRVTRLSGIDRYATAVSIATYGAEQAGFGWDSVGIATGEQFPDALSGGVLLGLEGSVMLLTRSTSLPDSVRSSLSAHADSIADLTYLGGTGAVSSAVRTQIEGLLQ